MTKGIIVLDEIPEKCNQCNFWFAKATVPVEYRCMGLQREITENELTKKKPDWCPIRPIPERKMCTKSICISTEEYNQRKGWNACLEEIEGKM